MAYRIEDIARAAGVSTATVSRVINRNYPVTEKTRIQVEKVIERLDYRPNVFARGLMNSSTDSVGIIAPYISNIYHTQIVNAIEETLSSKGIFLYLCCSADDINLEREYIRKFMERSVDAIIVIEGAGFNTSPDDVYPGLDISCPLILVNEHLAVGSPHHIVRCDQTPGLMEAFRRLTTGKRGRIILFLGEGHYSFDLKERLFVEHATACGLAPSSYSVIRISHPNSAEGVGESARAVKAALDSEDPPRAIFTGNDIMAIGVTQGVLEFGHRIPQDLIVISVDNTMIARISRPPMTAVDLRMDHIGREAAQIYLDLRESGFHSERPIRKTVASRLVSRDTG